MAMEVRPAQVESPLVVDPKMRAIFETLKQIAPTPMPVLLLGETGSGKEVTADFIHRHSGRAHQPFVKINCAGLTESVVESELFGHERGAFTGALREHAGLFEVAHGGTLFLDELGELPLRTQAKLLRVLELGELTRVGSARPRRVDVRFVAATHRDLPQLIAQGAFRHDLYFRLNGVAVEIPPLRDRASEIMPLACMFLRRYAERLERPLLRFAEGVDDVLCSHDWPGNVRELRSVVERSAAMCRSELIRADDVALGSGTRHRPVVRTETGRSGVIAAPQGIRGELRAFERTRILTALSRTRGNQTEAAKLLGVSRRTLTSKLKSLEIRERRGHFARSVDDERGLPPEAEPGDYGS